MKSSILLMLLLSSFFLNAQNFSQYSSDFSDPLSRTSGLYKTDYYVPLIVRIYNTNQDSRISFTYNSFNVDSRLVEVLGNGFWLNDYRNTMQYDNNNLLLTSLGEDWNGTNWEYHQNNTFTFDINGNLVLVISENRDNSAWVYNKRNTLTYDGNHNLITLLTERWQTGNWVYTTKETYTYNVNGRITDWLLESYANNIWENNRKETYTLDDAGNILTRTTEYWSGASWLNTRYSVLSYDSNNQMLSEVYSNWYNNGWELASRHDYTYANGNAVSGESFGWTNNSWEHLNENLLMFYNNNTMYNFYYGYKVDVTYATITATDDDLISPLSFSLSQNYPNPFNPSTVISYQLPVSSRVTLKLYDVLGNEVASLVSGEQEAGSYNVTFNSAGLASGAYIYKLSAGEFIITKKMLLLK